MRKNNIYVILISIITVATTLMSCNRKTVYNRYNHTPLAGWEKNDTLIFKIPPFAASGNYKEEIGLRINDSYPFMGLCLIVEQTILPSNLTKSDTINCKLFDKDGNVKGRGISYYQYNFHFTDVSVNAGDSIEIRVRHNMKREILPGISDIGIKIEGY